ncbi:cytoplasmic protein [Paxillus ammoniavirescens]|nr:cytoplasmic protein [Paxillus ammoniavirescens]
MTERLVSTVGEKEDLLLSCRYGDLSDVQDFITKFGAAAAADVQDDNGNTILHMTCANGHTDVLEYLLPSVPPSLLIKQNNAGSTPLHWAALNKHLEIAQKLVQYPGGPGVDMIDIKNAAGRSPLAEAEMEEWDDGAKWFVQVMKLDEAKEEEEDAPVDPSQAIEVEIQDADGQVAKMTINPKASESKEEPS